jgi:hypothetical protein
VEAFVQRVLDDSDGDPAAALASITFSKPS